MASKEALDRSLAFLACIMLAPLILTVVLAILITDGWPVFFRQERIGKSGRTFTCLKFRTMVPHAEDRLAEILSTDAAAREEWELRKKLRNDPRVSCIGRFLRQSSLDELPQLFNVMRGDMSLVGPRPICAYEIEPYGEGIQIYHLMKPGLTGVWQTCGRSETTFAERVDMDVSYFYRRSLILDLRIMLKTVPLVLRGDGAR